MPTRLSYPQALRPLDTTRDAVLAAFRSAGGDRNRWQRADWQAMADAMTGAEDALELRRGEHAAAERAAIRQVRRSLETD